MAKIIDFRAEPTVFSIPLRLAVYCENCITISNSRPYRCEVCGSESVLRVEPIFNRNPDPPAHSVLPRQLHLVRAVSA
jgi:hypothetical protein